MDHGIYWRGRFWVIAGGDEGDGQPGSSTTDNGTGQQGDNAQQQNAGDGDKRFTQAELDAVVADRLRRANEAADRKAATERQKAEDLAATEQGKFKELADQRQARIAEVEAQLAAANAAHETAQIRAAVEREAHQQGAVKADVVYRLVDRSAITLDDAGEVKGAEKAVKALLEAEPYLKAGADSTTTVRNTPRRDETQTDSDAEGARQAQGAWLRGRI